MSGKLFLMGDEFHGLTIAVTEPALVAHIPAAHFSANPVLAKEQFATFLRRLVAAIINDNKPKTGDAAHQEGLGEGLFAFLDMLQKEILDVVPFSSKQGPKPSPSVSQSEDVVALISGGNQVNNVGNCLVFDLVRSIGSHRGRREEFEQPTNLRVYLSHL
jgi:hypothetical protein